MNSELFADLVWKSQMGDANAMESLLLKAHAPVSYLANKILQNEESANQVTCEVLEIISGKLNTLTDPEQFQKWMCRITAARCMQVMPLFHQSGAESNVTTPWTEELSDGQALTEEESAQVIQQMVDSLPKTQRLCILLLGCGGLSIPAIAQLTGYSAATVTEYIQLGQNTIQKHLWDLQERNIQFSGLTSLTGILRIAMFSHANEEDAIAVVYGVLGKEIPVPPDPEKRIIRILVIILTILIISILAACGILVMQLTSGLEPKAPIPTTSETFLPATTAATEEATVPTTAATTTATEAASEETTVPETEAETTEPAATAAVPVSAGTSAVTPGTTTSGANGLSNKVPSDAPKTGEDGHTHRYLNTRTNFNCETGGIRHYLCADCDYYYTVDLSPSGSHNFIVVPAGPAGSSATCTKPGTALKLCTKCNVATQVSDPDNLPALGHDYSSSVVAPTATAQGYTLHTCSRCGDSYQDNFVDPVPVQTEAPAPSTEAASPSENSSDAPEEG